MAAALGVDRWALVLGGSMGGMRALEWASIAPDSVDRLMLLATCAAASAEQIALCSTQVAAIRADPAWLGGDYYAAPSAPVVGMGIARRIAHLSYRGVAELETRFGREEQAGESVAAGGRFAIESYLDHHAAKLARRFDAGSYVALSEAMNSHDVGRDRGGVPTALAAIKATTSVVSIDSDRPRGTEAAAVEIRTRSLAGEWSDWVTLGIESDNQPTEATRTGTAPYFVGDSDGVQVRVSSSSATTTLPGLQVSLIDAPVVAADSNPATVAPAAVTTASSLPRLYPQPRIVSRAGWGADESWRSINGKGCATPDIDDTTYGAVVHHTAGSNSYSASQSASIVRGIYAYHVKSQGWCDIGYNFLVDKYGTVFEGRAGGVDLPVHGAHATSWNTNTVGVSMMANWDTATPTTTVLNSVAGVIAWKLEGYYRNPTGTVTLAGKKVNVIFGHGDVMSTSCPGKNMRSRMGDLRQRVASKIGSWNTPIYRRWMANGGDSGVYGAPHIGEAIVGDGRYTRFVRRSLYYQPSLGTLYVAGRIRDRYDVLKGHTGSLGWPITDELSGSSKGSRLSRFANGTIYWSSATGAWEVTGEVKKGYEALGQDRSALGLPSAAQAKLSFGGAVQQKFAGGYLIWSSSTKAQPMLNPIGAKWMGFSNGGAAVGRAARRRASAGPGEGADRPADPERRLLRHRYRRARCPSRDLHHLRRPGGRDLSVGAADHQQLRRWNRRARAVRARDDRTERQHRGGHRQLQLSEPDHALGRSWSSTQSWISPVTWGGGPLAPASG